MKKRIFVGLPISARLTSYITSWRKVQSNLPVRWVHEENLHITLIPPWYEEDVQFVINTLQSLKVKSFSL